MELDAGAMGEEGEGLRPVSEADPRMSRRAGCVHDAGLFIVLAAQCGGIQDLSSSSRDRTHAPCIRSVEY